MLGEGKRERSWQDGVKKASKKNIPYRGAGAAQW
jgi:hypothetical protein